MNKHLRSAAMALIIVMVAVLAGCGDLFATHTVKLKSYYSSSIYTVEYKEAGDTEWKTAGLVDEDGYGVTAVDDGTLWDDEAFFNLPGKGTYSFRVKNILGDVIDDIDECEFSIDMGSVSHYDYVLSLDSSGELDFY